MRTKFIARIFLALTVIVIFLSVTHVAVCAAQKKRLPIYSVETPESVVSITFDAAWAAADTEAILEILDANDIKASFFLCGLWINKNPELLRKIHAGGHDICNHGDTHAHSAALSFEQNKKEIEGVHAKVKALLDIDMNLYRPPYGEYNDTVLDAAESLRYYTIQWDVDSLDWQNLGAEDELNRVLNHKRLRKGSILLFHTDAKYTVHALDAIIKGLKSKGFAIVPVSQLIYKSDYTIDHEGRQWHKPGKDLDD